ncbi:unnamed protein product [Ilex paraguariensis]|uniref:Uncharacterized protein n=1 Tax=Ilex paraguariensis TaxID=185542 RepID=A0ABC8R353_9AQUA
MPTGNANYAPKGGAIKDCGGDTSSNDAKACWDYYDSEVVRSGGTDSKSGGAFCWSGDIGEDGHGVHDTEIHGGRRHMKEANAGGDACDKEVKGYVSAYLGAQDDIVGDAYIFDASGLAKGGTSDCLGSLGDTVKEFGDAVRGAGALGGTAGDTGKLRDDAICCAHSDKDMARRAFPREEG